MLLPPPIRKFCVACVVNANDPNLAVRIVHVVGRLSWCARLLSVCEPTHVVVSGLYLGELAADEGAELW